MEMPVRMILAIKKLVVYIRNTTVMMEMNVLLISAINKLDVTTKMSFVMTIPV
jgi:hypothetical protein